MNMQARYIDTDYGRIWYAVCGEEKPGIPLLVVHGGPGFLSLPQEISELADERPVIFYDQLGCGRSERTNAKTDVTVDHYVDELAAVRGQLGLTHVHLMGQSWGAMLIAEYMLRHHPEGVHSLILSGPLLSTPMWEQDQRRYLAGLPPESQAIVNQAEQVGDFFGEDYQNVMMKYYQRHVCRLDPWPDFLLDALGKMNLEVYTSMWGPSEFTTTGSLKGADLVPRLQEIHVPVLLLCGEHDEAAPETVRLYRDAFPDAQMTVLPNASHLHHLEQPDLFRKRVRDFLQPPLAATPPGKP
jgi:proline iminopeptidase